jgi:hypothetical protein
MARVSDDDARLRWLHRPTRALLAVAGERIGRAHYRGIATAAPRSRWGREQDADRERPTRYRPFHRKLLFFEPGWAPSSLAILNVQEHSNISDAGGKKTPRLGTLPSVVPDKQVISSGKSQHCGRICCANTGNPDSFPDAGPSSCCLCRTTGGLDRGPPFRGFAADIVGHCIAASLNERLSVSW